MIFRNGDFGLRRCEICFFGRIFFCDRWCFWVVLLLLLSVVCVVVCIFVNVVLWVVILVVKFGVWVDRFDFRMFMLFDFCGYGVV